MSKKETTPKNKSIFLYLLLAICVVMTLYSYKKNEDYNKLETVFLQEKTDLKNELDELIEDYKDLSVKKKDLSKRLIREMNKIIALRDSVSRLKKSDYKLIRTYRKRISTLERANRDLFAKVDSLNIINTYLKQQNNEVVKKLEQQNTFSKELQSTNEELNNTKKALMKKIAIASELKANQINAVVMKERSSGKLRVTSKSSRADAFRVNFKLLKNEVTDAGEKDIYIQITDHKANVIASKGKVALKNKDTIAYSDKFVANYKNEELDVLSLILVSRDRIHKGEYNVNVFVDGNYVGKSTVSLR